MKTTIFYTFFILFFVHLSSCSSAQKKELIMDTHPNGNKKTVRYIKEDPKEDDLILEIHFYEDGQKQMEGSYLYEKREGKWSYWYKDGTLWTTGHYKEGIEHGQKIVWHQNGQKYYEGKVENDQRIGIWKFWDKEGRLAKEINYDE